MSEEGIIYPPSTPPISEVVCDIAVYTFEIAVAASVIAALLSAYFFLTSGGNSERILRGKKTLYYAVAGMAVLILAWGAAFIIAETVGGLAVTLQGCESPLASTLRP